MNNINHGKINLEQTVQLLKRKGMSPIANLLQCIYDNAAHGMNHRVSFVVIDGSEWIMWREERSVDGASQSHTQFLEEPPIVHDAYFGIKA